MLLDFDGTLAPLTPKPQQAKLEPNLKRLLRRLVGCPRARVYVLSGRPLAYLRRRVDVPGVHLLGLHGWERQGVSLPAGERHRLLRAKQWLERRLPFAPGIELEDKGLGLAVHYRGAKPQAVRLARRATVEALHRFQPGLRLLEGREIWELLPRIIDGKGATTQRLLAKLPPRGLPICLGDDASDESAFAALRRGLTIHVGGRADTRARFWVRSPEEVREFLERLEAMTR